MNFLKAFQTVVPQNILNFQNSFQYVLLKTRARACRKNYFAGFRLFCQPGWIQVITPPTKIAHLGQSVARILSKKTYF